MEKFICDNPDQIDQAAEFIINLCKDQKIWVFQGDLGVGKTTIIKALAKKMGVPELVSSPSFSIVNEYINGNGTRFYHFDFYRINHLEEAIDLGIEEYFYSGDYCWVEWAEKISILLPDNFAWIKIEMGSDQNRIITVKIMEDGI